MSFVYFAKDGDGRIKIGTTKDVSKRIATLNGACASGVTLLTTLPGDRLLEKYIHEMFAEDRLNGEWFTASPAVLAIIERVRDEGIEAFPEFSVEDEEDDEPEATAADSVVADIRTLLEVVAGSPLYSLRDPCLATEVISRKTGIPPSRVSAIINNPIATSAVEFFELADGAIQNAVSAEDLLQVGDAWMSLADRLSKRVAEFRAGIGPSISNNPRFDARLRSRASER